MNRTFKGVRSQVEEIRVYLLNEPEYKIISSEKLKLMLPNRPNNCLVLDILHELQPQQKRISQVIFYFKNNTDVQVEIEDRLIALPSGRKIDKFNVQGSKLTLENFQKHLYKYYFVGFHQDIFIEDDPNNDCNVYPTERYASYAECDSEFVKSFMKKNFPESFMPMWVTDEIQSVTTWMNLTGKLSDKQMFAYDELLFGITMSNCSLPCTRTKIQTIFAEEKYVDKNKSKINIIFENTVSIDRRDFKSFNPAHFVSSIGGSVGFWLGVGVMQSLNTIICFVFRE